LAIRRANITHKVMEVPAQADAFKSMGAARRAAL
jgi:hypothetical protein